MDWAPQLRVWEPKKILHVSDLHANDQWYDWLCTVSPKFGLVALSGDLLDLNAHRPIADQLERVIGHLRKIRAPMVAICSGNHDGLAGAGKRLHHASWLSELGMPAVRVDGASFEFAAHTIRCLGWNTPLPAAGANDVWLVHAPPDGAKTSIARGGVSFGSWDLARVCNEGRGPRLALGGHVHDPVGWHARVGQTWSLNPGFAAGAQQPNHNVIDLNRGVAVHHRATGEEDIVRLW